MSSLETELLMCHREWVCTSLPRNTVPMSMATPQSTHQTSGPSLVKSTLWEPRVSLPGKDTSICGHSCQSRSTCICGQ